MREYGTNLPFDEYEMAKRDERQIPRCVRVFEMALPVCRGVRIAGRELP